MCCIFNSLKRFILTVLALLGLSVSAAAQAVLLHGVENIGPTSNLVTIDSVTGQVVTVGQLQRSCEIDVCGLTGWNGGTLLYTDGTPGGVDEINPTNATTINTFPLPITDTGGLSYDSGTGRLFSINNGFPIVAQDGLGGPLVPGFGNPVFIPSFPGAMGGDDNGRHFVSGASAGISEFDPITGEIIRTFPRFSPNASGLAFDGISIFAVALGFSQLFELDPNSGAIKGITDLTTQGSLTALAYLPNVGAVPVPAAVWLFGTALIGLFGFGKRRKEKVV